MKKVLSILLAIVAIISSFAFSINTFAVSKTTPNVISNVKVAHGATVVEWKAKELVPYVMVRVYLNNNHKKAYTKEFKNLKAGSYMVKYPSYGNVVEIQVLKGTNKNNKGICFLSTKNSPAKALIVTAANYNPSKKELVVRHKHCSYLTKKNEIKVGNRIILWNTDYKNCYRSYDSKRKEFVLHYYNIKLNLTGKEKVSVRTTRTISLTKKKKVTIKSSYSTPINIGLSA